LGLCLEGCAGAAFRNLSRLCNFFFFGLAGPYEKLLGRVEFALDPTAAANARIIDLALAPKNARGELEFEAESYLLKPVQPSRGNERLLYEVGNRGGKAILRTFQKAHPSADPKTREEFGDGLR
jgi:hypothetical protein